MNLTQNLNDISNLSKPNHKLNSRENSTDRSTVATSDRRKDNSLPKVNNENKMMLSQVKEYQQILDKLVDIFKVNGYCDLVHVSERINKAMRAIPTLEGFCNEVCREVFDFEDTEFKIINIISPDKESRTFRDVIPILNKWKDALIEAEYCLRNNEEVLHVLQPVFNNMNILKPKTCDIVLAIQKLKGEGV